MLKSLDLFQSKITCPVRPSDEEICLDAKGAQDLNRVGEGNHSYLVLRAASGLAEVVKYSHTADYSDRRGDERLCVAVERDALNTGRWAFAPGTCVTFEWVEPALIELISQQED